VPWYKLPANTALRSKPRRTFQQLPGTIPYQVILRLSRNWSWLSYVHLNQIEVLRLSCVAEIPLSVTQFAVFTATN
jgi:hypothetical protein